MSQHEPSDLLRSDGHLSDLSLERHALDDLSPAERETAGAHLNNCGLCSERHAALLGDEEAAAALPLPAFLTTGGPVGTAPREPQSSAPEPRAARPRRARRAGRGRWIAPIAVLAAAASLVLVLRPQTEALGLLDGPEVVPPGPETIRFKSADVSLQLVLDNGARGHRLRNGDTVRPGDRIGFRVRLREPGWLMILGTDEQGGDYVCYPQRAGGQATQMGATAGYVRLPDAIRFDQTPGSERVVALLCPAAFSLATAQAALHDEPPTSTDGCARHEITLYKAPAGSPGE